MRLLWCNPCNELGLPNVELLAGELGELELAELFEELPSEESGDQGIAPGKDFVAFSCPLLLSPQVQDLLNAPLPRDRPVTIKGEVDQSVFLDLELNLRRMDLPLVFFPYFFIPLLLVGFSDHFSWMCSTLSTSFDGGTFHWHTTYAHNISSFQYVLYDSGV